MPSLLDNTDKSPTVGEIFSDKPKITARNVSVHYGEKCAIDDVSLDIGDGEVIAFIGPSGWVK